MSHVCNIKTTIKEFDFLVKSLEILKIKFQVEEVEKRKTIVIKDCNTIKEGAFIWNDNSFSFISDPVWSNEEQINRFLITLNKVYNKISFVNLANKANFLPVESQTNEIKQTVVLERFTL
jgi:hypothetical protein